MNFITWICVKSITLLMEVTIGITSIKKNLQDCQKKPLLIFDNFYQCKFGGSSLMVHVTIFNVQQH
jgi:hypothetical protein